MRRRSPVTHGGTHDKQSGLGGVGRAYDIDLARCDQSGGAYLSFTMATQNQRHPCILLHLADRSPGYEIPIWATRWTQSNRYGTRSTLQPVARNRDGSPTNMLLNAALVVFAFWHIFVFGDALNGQLARFRRTAAIRAGGQDGCR
jgi:hypothetical protein